MTSFIVHTVETAPDGAKARLESVRKAWGFVPQLQGTLAESPVALEAYDTLFGLVAKTTLTPQEQQLTFLAVSVENGCEYCTMGHTYLARAAKTPEAAIQAVRQGAEIDDPKLEALRRFAQAVVRKRGDVGDGAVEAFLAAGYDRENVLEVVTVVAAKTISNYVNHTRTRPRKASCPIPRSPGSRPKASAKGETPCRE